MYAKRLPAAVIAIAIVVAASLACTLGGGAEPTATPTPTPTPLPTSGVVVVVVTPTPPLATVTVATTGPTATATPTAAVGTGPNGCVLKSTYVADVTIPDGTVLAPSAPFIKTWKVRNDGTCTWDAGYQLVFAEGSQMSGPAAVNVPLMAPGETKDISVNLAAPAVPGGYTGVWKLRASNGALFGRLTVVIQVAGTPTPTATPTKTVTPSGGGPWGGTWETTFGVMNLVQAGNNVTGFYNNGVGALSGTVTGNLLSGTYSESGSTGTFDFWMEGSGLRWHGNWGKTHPWCGHRSGQADLSPCGVATWYGTWTTTCESTVPCGDLVLTQSGDSVSGTYAGVSGSVNGAVNGSVFAGTWRRNPGSPSETSGPFKFTMVEGGQQFQGSYNATYYWCGHRSGAVDPSPCFKN